MPAYNERIHMAKKIALMEKCFECFAENGLHGTSIRNLGKFCGCNPASLYTYFTDLDAIIVESTEYCMSRVEDDFMSLAPKNFDDLERFINEIPYWTAEKHGKKYRLMYQVYTHPKYRNAGKKFFEGVNQRYADYAKEVSVKIGLPHEIVRPMIFTFVRACVHYALYEDEFYLQEQLRLLKLSIHLFHQQYGTAAR